MKPLSYSVILFILTLSACKKGSHTVAQGSYLILPDTAYYIKQILDLHDFKTTGIFSLFTVSQLSANGQVLAVFNGFFMTVNKNTLTLSSVLTPGGNASYTFVRL